MNRREKKKIVPAIVKWMPGWYYEEEYPFWGSGVEDVIKTRDDVKHWGRLSIDRNLWSKIEREIVQHEELMYEYKKELQVQILKNKSIDREQDAGDEVIDALLLTPKDRMKAFSRTSVIQDIMSEVKCE